MSKQKMSRRRFLQGALLSAAGAAAAACQPKTVVVRETVEVEKVVEKEKEVTRVVEAAPAGGPKMIRIMLSSWAVAEVPFDQMAREFSDKYEDIEVKIDTSVDDTKVLAQIASDNNLANVKAIQSACKTGLPDNSIDVTLLYDTFHDLSEPDNVLRELHRVLKSGAILSFSDHHMRERAIVSSVTKDGLFKLLTKGRKTFTFIKA